MRRNKANTNWKATSPATALLVTFHLLMPGSCVVMIPVQMPVILPIRTVVDSLLTILLMKRASYSFTLSENNKRFNFAFTGFISSINSDRVLFFVFIFYKLWEQLNQQSPRNLLSSLPSLTLTLSVQYSAHLFPSQNFNSLLSRSRLCGGTMMRS